MPSDGAGAPAAFADRLTLRPDRDQPPEQPDHRRPVCTAVPGRRGSTCSDEEQANRSAPPGAVWRGKRWGLRVAAVNASAPVVRGQGLLELCEAPRRKCIRTIRSAGGGSDTPWCPGWASLGGPHRGKAVERRWKAVDGSEMPWTVQEGHWNGSEEGSGKAAKGSGRPTEGSGRPTKGSGKAVEGQRKAVKGQRKAVEGQRKVVEGQRKAVER